MDEEDFYQGIPPELRKFRDVPILGGLESIYAEYLSPTRFPVVTPRSQSTYEDMGVVYPGETIEGTYGEAEAALPPIVQGGIDFYRQFVEDPGDTAEAFVEAVKQIPSQQLAAGMAATQGLEGVKDADTGQISTLDPFLVTGSPALALGTARSIARTAGDGGTVLGIMGGRRSKTGAAREKTALSLRAMGKSPDDIFRSVKGYFDDAIFGAPTSSMSPGQEGFRFEIPTGNSSLRSETVGMKNIDYGTGEAFGLDDSYRKGVFIENGALVTLGGRALTLEEVVDFPELFDEYPQLRNMEVIRLTANEGESPFDIPSAAYIDASESPSGKPMIAIKDLDDAKEFQSVVFHEVQHAVQDIEGFPRGASAAQIYEMLEERFPEAAAKNPKALRRYAIQAYNTVYGEGEARAVQRRFENPEEALLNPVESLRKEISERETAMNELDVVDRVEDIDEALEPYLEDGIGSFLKEALFGPPSIGRQEARGFGRGGGRDGYTQRIQSLQKQVRDIRKIPNREEALTAVADAQRGIPEMQMRYTQDLMGGGVQSYAIEHTGDLLHRITEQGGTFGAGFAAPKIKNLIRTLESEYGHNRDFMETLRRTYSFYVEEAKRTGTPLKIPNTYEKFESKVMAELDAYANFHAQLPVFNDVQKAARDAAIAVGRRDFDGALKNLKFLDGVIEEGSFAQRNSAFDPDYESKSVVDTGIGPFGKQLGGADPDGARLLGGDKPQRFYHGSKTGFKEFDPDAEVTFVADRPSTAEYYTDFRDVYGRFPTQAEGANIRPVYLKDVNFFDVDNPEHIKQLRESDWYKSKKAELDDGFTYPEEGDFVDVVEAGNYEVIEDSGLIDWIKSQGFDGFTTYEQDGKNYGVFNVENIVPGVEKKAEGGAVNSGIAEFVPYMVR